MLRKSLNQIVKIGVSASGGAALEHGAGVSYTTAVSSVKMQNSQDKRTTGGVPGQTAQKRIEGSVLMQIVCNGGELQGMQWEVSGQNPLIVER